MSCLRPMQAWQDIQAPNRPIIWKFKELNPADYFYNSQDQFVSARYRQLTIPCGKCILCRKARAWEITIRAMMEYQAQPVKSRHGCFVTLTVDDEHMQSVFPNGRLHHKPFQDFMKRIRRKCERERYGYGSDVPLQYRKSLRFLMCGEYGEHTRRPHFHVCFFNEDFTEKPDHVFDDPLKDREKHYCDLRPGRWYKDGSHCDSPFVAECWPFGQIQCRQLDDNAIAYVAGYQLKLDPCDQDAQQIDYVDWWIKQLEFEDDLRTSESISRSYVKWSRRPGLGYNYMQKYDIFRHTYDVCDDGYKVPVICPSIIYKGKQVFFDGRYFKTKLQLTDPQKYDTIRALSDNRSITRQMHNAEDFDPVRVSKLENRAKMLQLKLATKKREVESDNRR